MSNSPGRPALFIDRDGTINRDCPYCHDPSDLHVYQDAVDLIREYRSKGYLVIVISNQSGIGRGYFTVSELDAFNDALMKKVKELGGDIDHIYYCPHRPDEGCSCRKPEPGMILQAVRDYHIDLSRSVVVGDREDIDGDLARRLGLKFILLKH